MLPIFLKTLPFFAIIGLGYLAAYRHFFTESATAYLTKFVFYFALPAMLLKFSTALSLDQILDWNFVAAYLVPSLLVYGLVTTIAFVRGLDAEVSAFEAQCSVIGNVGFLGIPMLAVLLGAAAIPSVMLVLAVDLAVFSSLIAIIISARRDGQFRLSILKTVILGVFSNPMVVAIVVGLLIASQDFALPTPALEFLDILGGAATPGALFAIGASLASKSAERLRFAVWLSFCKLVVHPAAVAVSALWIFAVPHYPAGVMIACAALPVAGNVYILAQNYGVAPTRVSASILVSTTLSIVTVSLVVGWVLQLPT